MKTRLAPHVEGTRKQCKRQKGERLAALAGLFRATEQAFAHRRVWLKLQRKLERADLPLRTVEFAYMIVGCGFLLAVFAALSGRPSLQILIAFAVGGAIPYGFVAFKARRQMTAFEDQLPDLLVTLAASLKAGHSFKQDIQIVVDEGQEPASKELGRVIGDTRLGRPMDEALAETAERIGSKNFAFVITAVTIQRQEPSASRAPVTSSARPSPCPRGSAGPRSPARRTTARCGRCSASGSCRSPCGCSCRSATGSQASH